MARIDADLQAMNRTLKKLDAKVRNRLMARANRAGLQIAVDRAVDIAHTQFRGEGFMAEHITQVKGRGGRYRIIHRMGVLGGAKKPREKGLFGLKTGTYRVSKTPVRRRGTEQRTGFVGFGDDGAAYYWRFHEFGTSKMKARPFLRPAFEGTRSQMIMEVKRILKKGIEREARRLKKR